MLTHTKLYGYIPPKLQITTHGDWLYTLNPIDNKNKKRASTMTKYGIPINKLNNTLKEKQFVLENEPDI